MSNILWYIHVAENYTEQEWMTIIKGNNMDGSNEIILKDKLDTKEFIIYNYKIKNRQN